MGGQLTFVGIQHTVLQSIFSGWVSLACQSSRNLKRWIHKHFMQLASSQISQEEE